MAPAIAMDDGIVLSTDVYRPVADGRYPVILSHGVYAKGLAYQDGYPMQWQIIRSGRFKGKKIELAPTDGVDMFWNLAGEFMEAIFEMEPGSYLITDESSLHDFEGVEDLDLRHIHERIRSVFDVDVSEVRSGNLVKIFARIHQQRMTDRDR